MWETEVAKTKWTRGACFPTMGNFPFSFHRGEFSFEGNHYWYDNRLDTDCKQFFPSFLLYNKGQLSGFGWDIMKKLDHSRRTEFPPKTALMVHLSLSLLSKSNHSLSLSSLFSFLFPHVCPSRTMMSVDSPPCTCISMRIPPIWNVEKNKRSSIESISSVKSDKWHRYEQHQDGVAPECHFPARTRIVGRFARSPLLFVR